jgi:hypothetical protein
MFFFLDDVGTTSFVARYLIFLARDGSIAPVSLGFPSLDPSSTLVFLVRDR